MQYAVVGGHMNLRDNTTYRRFINDRNRALEVILDHYLSRADRILDTLRIRVAEIVTTHFYTIDAMSQRIDYEFRGAIPKFVNIYAELRSDAYTLSYAGEAEAIGRTTSQLLRLSLDSMRLQRRSTKQAPSGGMVHDRVALALLRLRHKILDALALSRTLDEDARDSLRRVLDAFPPTKKISRPQRKLPRLKESRSPTRKPSLVTGIIDDQAWQDLVDTFTGASDKLRGPEDTTTLAGDERYTWEIEQDITQDFVEEVRSGQHDAAKENGITDFVWVAIVDDRTDKCCLWRDGLTTAEIKQRLRTDHKDDECQTEVPPAHFNCRCDLAPVTDKEGSEPKGDLGDFETWLTS